MDADHQSLILFTLRNRGVYLLGVGGGREGAGGEQGGRGSEGGSEGGSGGGRGGK